MARKEIKIFMDAKEAASFLKTIDWSWLFGFLSERYNVSLSPHKELKDNGAAIIKVEWPDELIEKCGMMADVFSSVKLVTFDSCFKEIVEYDEDKCTHSEDTPACERERNLKGPDTNPALLGLIAELRTDAVAHVAAMTAFPDPKKLSAGLVIRVQEPDFS